MRYLLYALALTIIVACVACEWDDDDPVGPPSLDVQYVGTVMKVSGATYETWSIEINYPNRGNATYDDRLRNDGSFVIMSPWGPSEPHIVTIRGVSNTEVWSLPNVGWESWGTNTYKYDFVIQ